MKNNWWKIAVVAILVIIVAVVIAGKNKNAGETETIAEPQGIVSQIDSSPMINNKPANLADQKPADNTAQTANTENSAKPVSGTVAEKNAPAVKPNAVQPKTEPVKTESKPIVKTAKKLPKLIDLGADKCVPCKMMAPILDEMKKEYKGKLTVEFYDVWENPDIGDKYGISSIPTQIFYDENGKEFFRHVGFYGKDDILAKFKEQGIDI